MKIHYENATAFEGDPAAALETARTVFVTNDFLVDPIHDNLLLARNPQRLRSNRQAALLAVTEVSVLCENGRITMRAEFGNIRRFLIQMTFFVVGLAFLLFVIFAVTGVGHHQHGSVVVPPFWFPFGAFLSCAPWPFILVFMDADLKNRTRAALDALLANMANSGVSGEQQ